MVINRINITMVGIILTIVFPIIVRSQINNEYPVLKDYRKWGIIAGPILYDKAYISSQYGDYSFTNKPIFGFNAGIEYNLHPSSKWSYTTGIIVALEPIYNIQTSIKKEDLYSTYESNVLVDAKMYSITSFSAPLLLKLNILASSKMFLNFTSGMKIMYFPSGDAEFTVTIANEDDTESRQVFGLRLFSPENSFQGSFVVGTGVSYALEKVLLKANLIYVMNFQNTISGEYQFANLFTSPDTRGYYDLSGNYLGLLFSVSLKKSKNK